MILSMTELNPELRPTIDQVIEKEQFHQRREEENVHAIHFVK